MALLTLNRPEQRNALSRSLVARLRDAVDQVESRLHNPRRRPDRHRPGVLLAAWISRRPVRNGVGHEAEEKSIATF